MKRFWTRTLVFVVLVFALQIGLAPQPIPDEIRTFYDGLSNRTPLIFLGDSTNFAVSPKDTDPRPISRMLEDLMPAGDVLAVDHGAYQMEVFLAYCNALARERERATTSGVVITINLRSFSPNWDRRPDWQFEKERLLLDTSAYRLVFWPLVRPLSVFKALELNTIGPEEYDQLPVYFESKQVGTVAEFRDPDLELVTAEETRRQMVFRYMYRLAPDHRKARAMIEVHSTLRAMGIEPLFYITPVDVETGERYLPNRFKKRIEANVRTLTSLLKSQSAKFIDLSQSVPSTMFAWKRDRYPNEHLNQAGRHLVATRLSEQLLRSNGAAAAR